MTQSYFAVPKTIKLNPMHYFIMKIPNKRELQQIACNLSSDIDFQDFMNLYKKCTEKQTKTIEEQGEKQVEALKALTEEELESIDGLFPKNMRTDEIKQREDKIKR